MMKATCCGMLASPDDDARVSSSPRHFRKRPSHIPDTDVSQHISVNANQGRFRCISGGNPKGALRSTQGNRATPEASYSHTCACCACSVVKAVVQRLKNGCVREELSR
eukprot:295618-Pelagomonas_calceolata.AAC.1